MIGSRFKVKIGSVGEAIKYFLKLCRAVDTAIVENT